MRAALALGLASVAAGLFGLWLRGAAEAGWPDPVFLSSFAFIFFASPMLAVVSGARLMDALGVRFPATRWITVTLFGLAFLAHAMLYISGAADFSPTEEELAHPLQRLHIIVGLWPSLPAAFSLGIFGLMRLSGLTVRESIAGGFLLGILATIAAGFLFVPAHVLGPIVATVAPLAVTASARKPRPADGI